MCRISPAAFFRGATVIAQSQASGQKFVAFTNASGEYLFPQLPAGAYSLSASAPDFKLSDLADFDVHASDHLRRNFTLQVGSHIEVVNVQDQTGNMQLGSSEIRDVVGPRQLLALPLENRQFLDLAVLTAGVVRPPGGTRGDAHATGRQSGQRAGPAQRTQSVPARWRVRHRRALQQHGRCPFDRRHRRGQPREDLVCS